MMAMFGSRWRWIAVAAVVKLALTGLVFALAVPAARSATPTVEDALALKPTQKDVDYDQPAPDVAAHCTMKSEKHDGPSRWVIRDPDGKILREFADTNGDGVVDRWSYYKDGVEVYRDIDANYIGKATEHRWLNTAGVRWGVSKEGNSPIDSWKMISAEEATAEVVAALRDHDAPRFNKLLLTPEELHDLGLSTAKNKELADKLTAASTTFADLADKQSTITAKSNWVHFGGNRPGIVPAGTFGNAHDIEVYENVVAVVETDGADTQIQIGTMIKAGDCWRLVDVPGVPERGKLADSSPGIFFVAAAPRNVAAQDSASSGGNEKMQKTMDDLQKFDQQITAAATPDEQAKLNDDRADYFEKVIAQVSGPDRAQWIRQMTDTISAAVQSGTYARGAERLKALYTKLEKNPDDADLAAYVEFRELSAEYALALQAPNPDFAKIQATWLQNLETFVGRHPKSPDTADALLQLGTAEEFAGRDEKAKQWYHQIVDNFDSSGAAKKAAGAIRRLESVGKSIDLQGKSTDGEQIDLSNYKGKLVVIHYWATWCEPCKVDLLALKELQTKYGSNMAIIGVSLDTNKQALDDFLSKNHLSWPQLYEPGGLDSRYADEMGILTLPTMILIDADGHVINRGSHISELDTELRNRLK